MLVGLNDSKCIASVVELPQELWKSDIEVSEDLQAREFEVSDTLAVVVKICYFYGCILCSCTSVFGSVFVGVVEGKESMVKFGGYDIEGFKDPNDIMLLNTTSTTSWEV